MSCSVSPLMLGFVLLTLGMMAGAHAPSEPVATRTNSTTSHQDDVALFNGTDSAVGSRVSTVLRDLPTIKNVVIFICVLTTLMIAYLVHKVYRSGKKIQKTRKYDIITTPAERVEMEPLNEENEDEEDSTLFDIKYS